MRPVGGGTWRDSAPGNLDWLGPWLDLGYIRTHHSEWMTFWTREVLEHRPREWIRWAMTEVQALKAVSSGTPGDNQIATYLIDFDIFVTADGGFAACVEILRPHAPRPLAATEAVDGGGAAVIDRLRIIAAIAH